jgi:hypothetical protein
MSKLTMTNTRRKSYSPPPSRKYTGSLATHSNEHTETCLQLPPGNAFLKLDSRYIDEVKNIEEIFYEFPNGKKKLPIETDCLFVLNVDNDGNYKLGIMEVNPEEYLTHHVSIITLMALHNDNKLDNYVISGELKLKGDGSLLWSDFSGTYFETHIEQFFKKSGQNSKNNNKSKYIDYIERKINPIIQKLVNVENIKFSYADHFIKPNNKKTLTRFISRSQRNNRRKTKKLYSSLKDCKGDKKPIGTLSDYNKLLESLNKQHAETREIIKKNHLPLLKKAHNETVELSFDEIVELEKILEMPKSPMLRNPKKYVSNIKRRVLKLLELYNLEEILKQ